MDYIALIHKEKKSDYGVSFPDFPGCITAGSTIEEAKDMAKEALQGHVETMLSVGESIPKPAKLHFIMKERESRDAIAFLVEVETPHDKYVRVNITMPEGLLKAITEYAGLHGKSRSAFIAEAARDALQ